jgi:prevent-host-death family protein
MRSVGAYEAKTHLPRLLEEVAKGETITITKHGVAVARLVPALGVAKPVGEIAAELRAFRASHPLGDTTFRELIDEGRH